MLLEIGKHYFQDTSIPNTGYDNHFILKWREKSVSSLNISYVLFVNSKGLSRYEEHSTLFLSKGWAYYLYNRLHEHENAYHVNMTLMLSTIGLVNSTCCIFMLTGNVFNTSWLESCARHGISVLEASPQNPWFDSRLCYNQL